MHESLSKKLKEYRSRHNLTQKELAARLFVSDKAISKWERGNGLPDIETLVRLADLLGTPVEELLKEKKETYYYEYKSERTVLRLPLMHILIPNLFLLLNQVTSVRAFFVLMKELPTASGWFSLGVKAKGDYCFGGCQFRLFIDWLIVLRNVGNWDSQYRCHCNRESLLWLISWDWQSCDRFDRCR